MSNQENILQQAKSGNPNAISMLLNKSLTAKGITIVKHDLKDNCLTLVLESDKSFNSATQSKIASFIESNLVKLDVSGISSVVVYGKVTNADNYSWQKDFSLVSGFDDIAVDDNVDSSTNNDSSNSIAVTNDDSKVNTEDSYTDDKLSSVKKVLDLAFLHKNLTCKVSLEDRCLRVVLDNVKLADKESCINVVRRQINYLKVEGVDSVNVYGMKEGDSIPVWSESIDLINKPVATKSNQFKGKNDLINKLLGMPKQIKLAVLGVPVLIVGVFFINSFLFNSPEKTVNNFLKALKDGNEEQASKYFCNESVSILFSVRNSKKLGGTEKTNFNFDRDFNSTNLDNDYSTTNLHDKILRNFETIYPNISERLSELEQFKYYNVYFRVDSSNKGGNNITVDWRFIVWKTSENIKFSTKYTEIDDEVETAINNYEEDPYNVTKTGANLARELYYFKGLSDFLGSKDKKPPYKYCISGFEEK